MVKSQYVHYRYPNPLESFVHQTLSDYAPQSSALRLCKQTLKNFLWKRKSKIYLTQSSKWKFSPTLTSHWGILTDDWAMIDKWLLRHVPSVTGEHFHEFGTRASAHHCLWITTIHIGNTISIEIVSSSVILPTFLKQVSVLVLSWLVKPPSVNWLAIEMAFVLVR